MELYGARIEASFVDETWIRTDGWDLFVESGGLLPFAHDLGASIFFFDVHGRVLPGPWSVGLALDGYLTPDDTSNLLDVGDSVTELIGSILAGYVSTGAPAYPWATPAPTAPDRVDVAAAARTVLETKSWRIDRGSASDAWRTTGPPSVHQLDDARTAVGADSRWLAMGPHQHVQSATLVAAADHWIHLESIDALVRAGSASLTGRWTFPEHIRIGRVESGEEDVVLFTSDHEQRDDAEILWCRERELGDPKAIRYVAPTFEMAAYEVLTAWASRQPLHSSFC